MSEDDDIKRNVEWFYRATIKQPRDTPAMLAVEAGCTVSVVEEGIAEAKQLLDGVQPAIDAGFLEIDGLGRVRLTPKAKQLPK